MTSRLIVPALNANPHFWWAWSPGNPDAGKRNSRKTFPTISRCRAAGLLLWALATALGAARGEAAAPDLAGLSAAIERAATEPDGDRVVLGHFSRALTIPVEQLRLEHLKTGLGWGDLLVAHRLSHEAPATFDPLVAQLRGGRSWADIASARSDLQRVVEELQRDLQAIEQRSEDKAPRTSGDQKSEKQPRAGGGTGRGRRP